MNIFNHYSAIDAKTGTISIKLDDMISTISVTTGIS